MSTETPRIGVDWGSSRLRAYLFDQNNVLIDSVVSDAGIKSIADGQFEATLFDQITHWIEPGALVLLSGMVTSRQGWVETPYITLPTELDKLSNHAKSISTRNVELIFLPGLAQHTPCPDVMRGEELQLLGVCTMSNAQMVVLPGTHSKWVHLNNKQLTAFRTVITGELFEVLLHSTLIGQLAIGKEHNELEFNRGVLLSSSTESFISELFQCRSAVLLNAMDAEHVYSFLSGLLIGNEIREGLSVMGETRIADLASKPIALVGSETLCQKYAAAFTALQIPTECFDENVTASAFAYWFSSLTG